MAQAFRPKLVKCTRSLISKHGAHESNEGRCQGHEPRSARSSTCGEHGVEEGGVCKGSEKLGGDWHTTGEERGQVCATWLVHDQDAFEAGDEGRQAGSIWQGRHGEGLPRLSIEEGFLKTWFVCDFSECSPWRKHAEHAFRVLGRLFVRSVLVHHEESLQ